MSAKHQLEETTHQKHLQKRLVLDNLQELHVAFHEKHSTVLTGFKKCAELCPKHCIFAGERGTHTVRQCCSLERNIHGAKSTPYT
jgi:hypothetical protein